MKVITAEVIKNGEQELIDAINGELDWEVVERAFRQQHGLDIDEDIIYKRGDLVVHDKQVAYRLEFEVKVIMAVLMDREGNYLSVGTSAADNESQQSDDSQQTAETMQTGQDGSTAPAQSVSEQPGEERTDAEEAREEAGYSDDTAMQSELPPDGPMLWEEGENGDENEAVMAALASSLDPPPVEPSVNDPRQQTNTASSSTDISEQATNAVSDLEEATMADEFAGSAVDDPDKAVESESNRVTETETKMPAAVNPPDGNEPAKAALQDV